MALTESTMLELGTRAPDFTLTDATTGQQVTRAQFIGKPLLVVFMCNHCPFVIHLADALAAFGKQVQDKGVAMVGISANDVGTHPNDGPDKMKLEAAQRGYTFPYLYDETQAVAQAYKAACTPDFFLFDKEHRLVYRGQFDETRPDQGKKPTGADLHAAVNAVLSGGDLEGTQYPSAGCNIKWKPGNEPQYV